MELCRARWELCRNHPEADEERLVALADLAAALENSGDLAAAWPLLEEQVGAARRTRGDGDPLTLMTIARLGGMATNMGEAVEARPLLEEAVAGLRLKMGSEHEATLCAVVNLAFVHAKLGAVAKARLLMEEVVAVQPVDPARFTSIGHLGSRIFKAGDNTVGVALRE
eukprot:COSAG06_NODE_114_length_23375_cov_20.304219_9_plen_168_part_00